METVTRGNYTYNICKDENGETYLSFFNEKYKTTIELFFTQKSTDSNGKIIDMLSNEYLKKFA